MIGVVLLVVEGTVGRTLLPGAECWGLVVGAGDLLQEGVHLPQGQGVVECLQRPDTGRPILSD